MACPKKVSANFPAVVGVFMVGSLSAGGTVSAADNPFASTRFAQGYMLAEAGAGSDVDDKNAEAKCGGKNDKEAVCGIYVVGSGHKDESKVTDGKCGGHKAVEALCGGAR
jgi:uncharacterized low-complexity protein